MNKEWFKEWFESEDYLDVYNHRDNEDANQLLKLILNAIHLRDKAPVLDAACGGGRHSIYLAENGYTVTGFDLSSPLLNLAILEAKNRNLEIEFISADIREFNSVRKFDLILNLFTSFGYFESDNENFVFFKNSYNMLNSKGYFVLDFLNKKYLEDNLISYSERENNNKLIRENRKIKNDRIIKKIQIEENLNINKFEESVRLYSHSEIKTEFENIGFNLIFEFGNYSGEAFSEDLSERFIGIFQK